MRTVDSDLGVSSEPDYGCSAYTSSNALACIDENNHRMLLLNAGGASYSLPSADGTTFLPMCKRRLTHIGEWKC